MCRRWLRRATQCDACWGDALCSAGAGSAPWAACKCRGAQVARHAGRTGAQRAWEVCVRVACAGCACRVRLRSRRAVETLYAHWGDSSAAQLSWPCRAGRAQVTQHAGRTGVHRECGERVCAIAHAGCAARVRLCDRRVLEMLSVQCGASSTAWVGFGCGEGLSRAGRGSHRRRQVMRSACACGACWLCDFAGQCSI